MSAPALSQEKSTGVERIKISDACDITGLCERTLQDLSARGEIWGAAKLGRRWTYDRQRLRAWVLAKENAVASRRTSTSGRMAFSMPVSLSTDATIDDRLKQLIAEKLNGVSGNG